MTNDKLQMTNKIQNPNLKIPTRSNYLILAIIIALFGFSPVYAQSSTVVTSSGDTTQLSSKIGGLSIGYIRVGTDEVANLAWHPDFKFGSWGLGADVNIALGSDTYAGYENLVLRYLEYDDGKKGLRYGVVESLTWGHGLLLDGYSTTLTSDVLLDNTQMAWKGYVDMNSYVVRALTTRTGVNALRVEEEINPMLMLGETYITDGDGITIPGTSTNQQVSGIGIDATTPLPANFEGYAEYAQLINRGGGFTTGISWGQDFMVAAANFNAGYRFLDSRFIPGYFNAEYETNPINLSSAEATGNTRNGFLAKFGVTALGLASLNVRYEDYTDSAAALSADLSAKLPQDVEVTGYYEQPSFVNFKSLSLEEGAILGGTVAYPVNPYSKVVVHYKRAYNSDTGQVEETQYYEMQLNF